MSVRSAFGRGWDSVRRLSGRTPLRVKLISSVIAFVAVALMVISVVGISVFKHYLLTEYDNQLQGYAHEAFARGGEFQGDGGFHSGRFHSGNGPVVEYFVPHGGSPQVVRAENFGPGGHPVPGPQLPKGTSWYPAHETLGPAGDKFGYVTVAAVSGSGRWRVILVPALFDGVPGTLVFGVDVTYVYTSVGALALIDLIVSVAIIVLLAIAGIAVIRASLRPLTDIEHTAGAIAAGDLTRRVPDRDPRTEVGRLGRSLNAMLTQIEAAFDARARSEAAARRSEDKMRQFVADASHELRTPLTAIRGFAEYYRQRGMPGPVPDAAAFAPWNTEVAPGAGPLARADLDRIMRRVEQESARMGVLVEDMLLLARLDQQRPLERKTVDLITLAADAVHDARVVAPDRSINLTVDSGPAMLVVGDEVRLRQVIGNLMSNALTHTPDGTAIDVRLRSGSLDEGPAGLVNGSAGPPSVNGHSNLPLANGVYRASANGRSSPAAVVLEVTDNGPGLTPEQAEHVFERFYRADQARTRKAGGAGLGLAIVAALVAAHGGAVWVDSAPGRGATFRIALPLAPEATSSASGPDQTDAEITDPHRKVPPVPPG
jgi:two-component system, OmpR family, sensor kinase